MQPTGSTGEAGVDQLGPRPELTANAPDTGLDRPAGPKAGAKSPRDQIRQIDGRRRRRGRRVRETPDGQLVFYL